MADCSISSLEIVPVTRISPWAAVRAVVPDLLTLTKPEVNFLIVIATLAGFYLGWPNNLSLPIGRLLNTLWGTLLVASGTGALNQYREHRFDAQMRRTWRRPVAAGRLSPFTACWFGVSLSAIGTVYLLITVNALASGLAVLTLTSYLIIYTPLKRKTPLCTLVGAFPGAMPPLIGWAAASGCITSGTPWILYAVLFLWQFPHFMAIAWMYREDYARAGYRIFPVHSQGSFLAWVTLGPTFVLLIVGLMAVAAYSGGMLQYGATALLGSGLIYYATRLVIAPSGTAARELLKSTIVYLPLEFLILVLGKG